MKLAIDDIGGEVVKEDDRYVVKDNKLLPETDKRNKSIPALFNKSNLGRT